MRRARTELDRGMNGITFAAGAFSSLGTLFGVSAHIGLYSNLYLVPLTKACLEGVAKIAEHMHDQNKTWVEAFGAPGNYMVEPGGEPMWRYMTSVIKAKSEKSVAEPSDEVAAYFLEHRGLFDTGVNATARVGGDAHHRHVAEEERSTRRSSRRGSGATATPCGRCSTAR